MADGDVVVVDVKGTADDDEVEEYSGAGMSFEVGAGNMIAGFDDAVRGAAEGDGWSSPTSRPRATMPTGRSP